jgi:hypothetical protein
MGERTRPLRAAQAGTMRQGHVEIQFCSASVLIDSKKLSESQGGMVWEEAASIRLT